MNCPRVYLRLRSQADAVVDAGSRAVQERVWVNRDRVSIRFLVGVANIPKAMHFQCIIASCRGHILLSTIRMRIKARIMASGLWSIQPRRRKYTRRLEIAKRTMMANMYQRPVRKADNDDQFCAPVVTISS